MRLINLTHSLKPILFVAAVFASAVNVVADEADSQTKSRDRAEGEKEPAKRVPFTISRETTRITKPLKANGQPDYAAAINQHFGKGATPENNAAVPLMRAFGAKIIDEENRPKFYKLLGVDLPQDEAGTLVEYDEFVEEQLKPEKDYEVALEKYRQLTDQLFKATDGPWTRDQCPLVAKWVDANAESVKLAFEASNRARLYVPLVIPENEPLVNLFLPLVQKMRVLARLLNARSMLAIAEGRIEDAQKDLVVCHRLAEALATQSTLIQALVGYSIEAMACYVGVEFIQSKKITQRQLAAYRQELAALSTFRPMWILVDEGERLYSMDTIAYVASGPDPKTAKVLGLPEIKTWQRAWPFQIKWDSVFKKLNETYDKSVAVLKIKEPAVRLSELRRLTSDLEKLSGSANDGQLAAKLSNRDLENSLAFSNLLNLDLAAVAEGRANTRRDLLIIALALAEYRLDNGSYPESLDQLTPNLLKIIPNDGFSGKRLKYKKQKTGFLLYSVGPNLKDDGGKQYGGEGDDIAIRVPRQME